MIVKPFLLNRKACFFRNNSLCLINYHRYRRGGHWPPVRACIDLQQQMDVVWHDHILINCDALYVIPGYNVPLYDLPNICKLGIRGVEGAAPYDVA